MTSFQITEDLLAQEKAWFPINADVDSESDDSSEEEHSPEPEESIQGPSTGFSKRGPQKHDCDVPPKKDKKKDKNNCTPPIAPPRKTTQPPPEKKPNPVNYSTGQTKQGKSK
ncbi:uncharacterized protein HD556DRAFT_1449370 [Suillus plorans]|uniref:Uncharacterized protein n=1 Tax=Suillus plorans TaxID=116603 RepID=A0A9P7DBR5_9AGAM|nr:uncharacterized protein HD556DRAFT_1449370 [Suillus plorans]KAG1786876.1 hypothetical protein HD556DRAFT_1449370 [Suillus plorans]